MTVITISKEKKAVVNNNNGKGKKHTTVIRLSKKA